MPTPHKPDPKPRPRPIPPQPPGDAPPAKRRPPGKPTPTRHAPPQLAGGVIKELGGPKGLEPTRFGDWEQNGRCSDF